MMLVEVGRFLHAHEAHVLRSRLDAEGLFAVVDHELLVRANWSLALAYGGVKVWVHRDDVLDAHRIMAAAHSGQLRKELADAIGDLDDFCCSACGSAGVASSRLPSHVVVSLLVLLMFGIAVPVTAVRHRCATCGTVWRGRGGY
jgi:hypothetical protein